MRRRVTFAIAGAVLALALVPIASAGSWSTYWGPGTFMKSPPTTGATSGYNYWTSQRVYRPTGHPFYLYYNNGSAHYSTDNSTDNPFVWTASGYNLVGCFWDYQIDSSSSVSPVTCEAYA